MEKKNSFILYTDYFEHIKDLTDKQTKQLLHAIFLYQLGEPLPKLDKVTSMAFSFISGQFKRDDEKYEEVSKKRSAAGKKGGKESQKKQRQANEANACFDKQIKLNDTDTDTDTDTDIFFNGAQGGAKKKPTENEIKDEAKKIGKKMTGEDVKDFVEYNDAAGWKVDWKYALKNWKVRPKGKTGKTGFNNFPERRYDFDDLEKQLLTAQVGE